MTENTKAPTTPPADGWREIIDRVRIPVMTGIGAWLVARGTISEQSWTELMTNSDNVIGAIAALYASVDALTAKNKG